MIRETDIAILGAGPTGLALALALRDSPWRVTLFDGGQAGSAPAASTDPRAIALSEGSRHLLKRLDAWPQLNATALRDIDISQQRGHASTTLRASALGIDALGHVVRYGALLDALRTQATAAGMGIAYGCRATSVGPEINGQAPIRFDGGSETALARLVIHAEGTHDEDSWQVDYAQSAIVCEATPTLQHRHLAYERFTPDGPLALLPLGDHYAIVRIVPTARRAELLALDDAAFAEHLKLSLGHRVAFSAVGPRSAFPLALRLRRNLQCGREVWIGNAAQTLHPVSGQGFNLGLRDAWTLAETLLDSANGRSRTKTSSTNLSPTGIPSGHHGDSLRSQKNPANATSDPANAALAAWARARQPDRYATTAFTDGIVRLFSNDIAPLRQARDLGLSALDLLPGLRNFVARRMIWGARGW